MKTALITQSNYLPWKGYFQMIHHADVFVVYDDVQYTKRDWRNRNKIKTADGLKWLTVPVEVKGKYFQKISDTKVLDHKWIQKHLGTIKHSYNKAPYFDEVFAMLSLCFEKIETDYLSEINVQVIGAIMQYIGIDTKIVHSSSYDLDDDRNYRLIQLCKELDCDHYISGPSAQAYLNVAQFEEFGVSVKFYQFDGYPEYDQFFPPFEHKVSIIDLLMHCGPDSMKYLKGNDG